VKKNALIFVVLAFLAVVPVTLSFLTTGKNEDRVREVPPPSEPEEVAQASEPEEVARVAESASVKSSAAEKSASTKPKVVPIADAVKIKKGVPIFKGYEDSRYQMYDRQIQQFADDFNKSKARWAGGTPGQGEKIEFITPAQIKAHMIQETGGGDLKSRTAWKFDPLQVNVPGDWNPYKKYLGLRQPRRCNEGTGANNLKAGLMLLVRKGFGVSGQPAGNRPEGAFDGWPRALQRYNGRSDKAATGEPYSEAYSARIRQRAANPAVEVPIPIPTMKKR